MYGPWPPIIIAALLFAALTIALWEGVPILAEWLR